MARWRSRPGRCSPSAVCGPYSGDNDLLLRAHSSTATRAADASPLGGRRSGPVLSSSSGSTPAWCRRPISMQAVRFIWQWHEPAGVEVAALTALARPAHARWFASGLCISEVLLSRRYPERFLVSALAPKYLILLARPEDFRTPYPQIRSLTLKKPTTGRRRIDLRTDMALARSPRDRTHAHRPHRIVSAIDDRNARLCQPGGLMSLHHWYPWKTHDV